MPRRRGTARRSFARRRIRRVRVKWTSQVIPRRFKKLEKPRVESLVFEWEMLDYLELGVFDLLEINEIPSDVWEYFMAFAKRMYERGIDFNSETFRLEKTSLVNEFVARGHDVSKLSEIQVHAENIAKLHNRVLTPTAWAYDNAVGTIFVNIWGAYDTEFTGSIWTSEPEGSNGGYYDNRE